MNMFLDRKKKKKDEHIHPTPFQIVFFGVCAIGFFIGGTILLWAVTLDVPSIDDFTNRRVIESTKIYDRTGDVLLYDVHGNIRRTIIPLEEMSRHIRNATIAIEDEEFYNHHGVRPTAFMRAVIANIKEGRFSQGGSTITQQVVKNTVLSPEKTITRKVKEWILALKLERLLEKDDILEIYLNETPYGGTLYGVEEASLYFFGKNAADVSLTQAAYLAALPQAPSYYSPYGNRRDELENRKNLVLMRMLESGFITQDEYETAVADNYTFEGSGTEGGIKAPHFVFYVREYLEETYGIRAVNEGGLKVITTLDYDLHRAADEIVRKYALTNEERFNAENASLVAIDPKTGQILTMIGSRGYFDEEIEGKFNVAIAKRQPGSVFKPFVYAAAFTAGYTPDTVLFDLKTQFSTSCEPDDFSKDPPCFSPDNYDNVFRGPISLRNALAQSVNVPAVKTLYLVGIPTAIDLAEKLGITTLSDSSRLGLTLVLGGGEVSLLEVVSAYGVFANDGVRNEHTSILRIEDAKGTILEEFESNKEGERVLESSVARNINSVLSDNVARTPAFGENSHLRIPGHPDVAVKTGTTNDYVDAWIVGYTPTISVGAWAGNNNSDPMERRVAGLIIAPLWNEFMQEALTIVPTEPFLDPFDPSSDLPPLLKGEWNHLGNDGQIHSILYWIDRQNPLGGRPIRPESSSQFHYWEYPISLWGTGATSSTDFFSNDDIFDFTDDNEQKPLLTISHPQKNSVVQNNSLLTITISYPDLEDVEEVSYYMNGMYMGSSATSPYSLSVVPKENGVVRLRAAARINGGVVGTETTFIVE